MGEKTRQQEYQHYRNLMYSGGYDPVSYEEWQGIFYPPDLIEMSVIEQKAAADNRLTLMYQAENARLRAALFNLLDMCDVQARNDGVLTVLREAMEQVRSLLADSEDAAP